MNVPVPIRIRGEISEVRPIAESLRFTFGYTQDGVHHFYIPDNHLVDEILAYIRETFRREMTIREALNELLNNRGVELSEWG